MARSKTHRDQNLTQHDYWQMDHDRIMEEMGRAMAEKIDRELLNQLLWESTLENCVGWTPVELRWEKGKDTSYFWNEACAWAIEQFGLPGENYVTHPTEENMLFLFRHREHAVLMTLKWI
jgi:hypothetical protein